MPLVDVIIPTYERPSLTARAVASVRAQTDHRWRAIISDDHSSSDSIEQLRSLCDDRVVLIESERNSGPQAARQRGYEASTAEWVALLDSDDVWLPDKLERQLAEAGDADIVLCRHRWLGESSKPVNDLKGHGALAPLTTNNMSIPLIRRSALDRVGGMLPAGVPSMRTAENLEFYVRLAGTSYRTVERHLVDCWSHTGERASDGFGSRSAADGLAWITEAHATHLGLWPSDYGYLLGRTSARYFVAGARFDGWRYYRRALMRDPLRTIRTWTPTAVKSTLGRDNGLK